VALVTTGQLAEELGVSRGAINKWHREGLITPVLTTPGGHHRWAIDEVRRQLAEQRKRDD
jgi:DNA-binding transcriptional MerR regulator